MFNLTKEVIKLQQLEHTKIYGLPYKPRQSNPKVQHIDNILFDINAEQESLYIDKRFRNYSICFGRRLSKRKGQYHRPGGGYAGHTIKEIRC